MRCRECVVVMVATPEGRDTRHVCPSCGRGVLLIDAWNSVVLYQKQQPVVIPPALREREASGWCARLGGVA